MRANAWKEWRFESVASLAGQTSKVFANSAMSGGDKLISRRLTAGFEWNKPALRKVAGCKLSSMLQKGDGEAEAKTVGCGTQEQAPLDLASSSIASRGEPMQMLEPNGCSGLTTEGNR